MYDRIIVVYVSSVLLMLFHSKLAKALHY